VNNIPPLDLAKQYQTIQDEVSQVVLEVLASGRYIGGAWVEAFEQQFAAYIGVSECVACNSGTDALYLALRALNIGPGDEVITTPFTFIATAEVISEVGATPVFVDVDPQTYNIDPAQIEPAITSKTRAIIPVHLFGQPANLTEIMAIAKAHNLVVIEDCAQSAGATWHDQQTGSIGQIGCFSFFPTKNLGACGDGGALTTNDPAIAATVRMLKDHGARQRYYHEAVGVNSRLDALQAAILQVKLRYLEGWNQQRRTVAQRYHELLSPVSAILLPQELSAGQSVWNQYTIRVPSPSAQPGYRDRLRERLQAQGVSSMVYYPIPLHLQPVYHSLGYQPTQLPVAEQLATEVLSLPMYPELDESQQMQVVYSLKDSLASDA
jgi:dTDP-4-amino-4,6-dideoxygalactose transaminase